ncbi:hypothetical protein ACFLX5_02005 [Chloroflexota bacterium]
MEDKLAKANQIIKSRVGATPVSIDQTGEIVEVAFKASQRPLNAQEEGLVKMLVRRAVGKMSIDVKIKYVEV